MQVERRELLAWARTDEMVRATGVTRRTAQRWKRGTLRCPEPALRLLEMYFGGHVGPAAGDRWRGWYFDREGMLHDPEQKRMRIGGEELSAYFWLRQQAMDAADVALLIVAIARGMGADAPIEAEASREALVDV